MTDKDRKKAQYFLRQTIHNAIEHAAKEGLGKSEIAEVFETSLRMYFAARVYPDGR